MDYSIGVSFRCSPEFDRQVRMAAAAADQNRSKFILAALREKLARTNLPTFEEAERVLLGTSIGPFPQCQAVGPMGVHDPIPGSMAVEAILSDLIGLDVDPKHLLVYVEGLLEARGERDGGNG